MKKIIRDIKGTVVTVTTVDERWYVHDAIDPVTGLPFKKFVPSVTWICSHYPKGVGFFKWLASKGWDEAEAIKTAAGDKGSKVHHAIVDLIDGKEVAMDAKYFSQITEQYEELTVAEYDCLLAFADFWKGSHTLKSGRPRFPRPVQTLGREINVWNGELDYMGMVDWYGILEMPDKTREMWLLDWKTGQNVWPEYELQVSAYKHARPTIMIGDASLTRTLEANIAFDRLKLGILQVGYRNNERGWLLTEVEDQFHLFEAAYAIWQKETFGQRPLQRDYPLSITLETK